MLRNKQAFVVPLLATLLWAGCGGDDSTSGTESVGETTSTTGCVNASSGEPAECNEAGAVKQDVYDMHNGGTTESTSTTATTTSAAETDEACGASEAQQIAENLENSGYKGVKVVQGKPVAPSDDESTNVLVKIDELGALDVSEVFVYCSAEVAKSNLPEDPGKGTDVAAKAVGPAVYFITATQDYDPLSGKPKPMANIEPLLEELVAAGSGSG